MGMLRPAHPEVLGPDWLPPIPLARRIEVDRARRYLLDGGVGGGPAGVAIVGPVGSGTSTVARYAARAVADELPREEGADRPLLTAVRVRQCRGAQGVAAALLTQLDAGFQGRGFHVTEIIACFLRRLRRAGRPVFVVLDDLGPAVGDLGVVVRALTEPDRFLPEGQEELPPIWLVLAGPPEATSVWTAVARCRFPGAHRVVLDAYPAEARAAILTDRAARAFGRPPPEPWMERLLARVDRHGLGISAAMDLVRREIGGQLGWSPHRSDRVVDAEPPYIEPHLWAALAQLGERPPITIAELRRLEGVTARQLGARPLPPTTFWRRIVRLESIGVVHREVRSGGAGGTRSLVGLLHPIPHPDWTATRETRPADAGAGPMWGMRA
jgi:hypothetical protein